MGVQVPSLHQTKQRSYGPLENEWPDVFFVTVVVSKLHACNLREKWADSAPTQVAPTNPV
jgi:hypothetical protein